MQVEESSLWAKASSKGLVREDRLILYKSSISDANLYVLIENGIYVIIVLFVNDLIMVGDHNKNIQKTREWLSSEFEMTDLGLLYFCLEIEVWQENIRTFISQHNYARELLNTFDMSECKEVVTPMEMNVKLTLDPTLGLTQRNTKYLLEV